MENLEKALKIIDSISRTATREEALKYAKEAYELSNNCYEAIVIMSRCEDEYEKRESILLKGLNINEHIDDIKYELGSLYFEYGMYRKSLNIFEELYLKKKEIKYVYRLLSIYALFEDEKILDVYNFVINDCDDQSFVRYTFPYMIYTYKNGDLKKTRELFKEINKKNPEIINVLNNKIGKQANNNLAEAYSVIRNNGLLINSCVELVNYLVGIC